MWIIVALSLFCINSLNQITAAAGFVAAFYLLARSISAIQLMSHSSLLAQNSWERIISSRLADALALVLPGLDRFTQTTWLVDGAAAWSLLPGLLLQTLIYCVCCSPRQVSTYIAAKCESCVARHREPGQVPFAVIIALALAGLAQMVFAAARPAPAARASELDYPPGATTLRVASVGEPIGASQGLTLSLQAYDNQPGISIPFLDLDYDR